MQHRSPGHDPGESAHLVPEQAPVPEPAPSGRAASQATAADAGVRAGRDRDSYAVTAFADIVDRSLNAAVGRFTMGLSPAALMHAYLDWVTAETTP